MNVKPSISAFLIAVGGLSAGNALEAQTVDTSDWICEYCPFEDGSRGDYEVGASSVSDDSAYLGNATGYDEEGVYANLDGDGSIVSDKHRARWMLEDLALDSRYAAVEGGRPGTFDYHLAYRELPYRRFNTTSTVFARSSGDTLTLPSGWDPQPTTGAMAAQIDNNLRRRTLESDRQIIDIGGQYLTGRFSFTADYRQQKNDGVKVFGGSAFTNAALLPMPFDYVTDEVDLGVRYGMKNGFVSLAWYLSDFDNDNTALGWDHPFGAAAQTTPDRYAAAQAPDNQFSQLSLAGGYAFEEFATRISVSAAFGQIEQDAELLAYTVNPDVSADPLPRSSLDGEIDTSNYAIAITSRPIERGRVRFSYRYDERDNKTPQDLWRRVIVDSGLIGGVEENIPYSFERSSLKLSGDYDLMDSLRVSAGYERKDIDRDFQEVAEQTEDTGWGRLRWRPASGVEIDVRGGGAKRDIDEYNEVFAAEFGQNPLMRKYNLAYRERRFGEVSVTWAPADTPITITFDSLFADDDYAQSELGLIEAEESHYSIDLGWAFAENGSVYVNLGTERIESEQLGSEAFAVADWRADNEDRFTTFGAGFRVREIREKWDLAVDFARSDGTSEIELDTVSGGIDPFPDLETSLDDLRVSVDYQQSAQLNININLRYQRFEADDWALEGVTPTAIPTVLSLGAEPWDDDTLIVGIGFRYKLGE